MSITPLRFTGISQFSEDFQTIVDRALAIAQLPIQSMQNQQADLITKKQLLATLGSKIQTLANAVAALGGQGASGGLTVTSSDTSKVTASLTTATSPATYVISDITSVARRATESTLTGLATLDQTAVDVDDTLELVFDGQAYTIDLTSYGNNLNGLYNALRAKIDAQGLGLTVSLINAGSGATPYHLTLSATNSGARSLQLWTEPGAAGANLLSSSNQGANAVFQINGIGITSTANLVTGVAPGINLNIAGTTGAGETVTIDLSSSRTPVQNALATLVDAYNAVAEDLNAQIGDDAGLLSGDYLIGYAKGLLRQIIGYQDTGGVIQSLADLGIELDTGGKMSFNSTTFNALSYGDFQDAFRFLGSETSGFGSLASSLDQLSHPLLTDLIDTQIAQYDAADDRLQQQIEVLSERITLSQTTLLEQLQQADVLLASLESQQQMLDASLEAVSYALYGRRDER
jgi:flagellar hook-associated protein 2